MSGRLDKRFCSNQCRANAHNAGRLQNSGEQLMLSVNAILRRNRTILKQASPQGNTYYFCYDYGYFLLEDEKVLIVNWQPYMEQSKV
jgi:hypothetical protein